MLHKEGESIFVSSWDHDSCFDILPDGNVAARVKKYQEYWASKPESMPQMLKTHPDKEIPIKFFKLLKRNFYDFLVERFLKKYDYLVRYNGSYCQTLNQALEAAGKNGLGDCFKNHAKVHTKLEKKSGKKMEFRECSSVLIDPTTGHRIYDGKLSIMTTLFIDALTYLDINKITVKKFKYVHFDDDEPGNIFSTMKTGLIESLSQNQWLTPELLDRLPDDASIGGLHFSYHGLFKKFCQEEKADFQKTLCVEITHVKARIQWRRGWVDPVTRDTPLHRLVRESQAQKQCESVIYELWEKQPKLSFLRENQAKETPFSIALKLKNFSLAAFLFIQNPLAFKCDSHEELQMLFHGLLTHKKIDHHHPNYETAIKCLCQMGAHPEKHDAQGKSPLSIELMKIYLSPGVGSLKSIPAMLESCRARLGGNFLNAVNDPFTACLSEKLKDSNVLIEKYSIMAFLERNKIALKPEQIDNAAMVVLFHLIKSENRHRFTEEQDRLHALHAPLVLANNAEKSPLLFALRENKFFLVMDLLKKSKRLLSHDEVSMVLSAIDRKKFARSLMLDFLMLVKEKLRDQKAGLKFVDILESEKFKTFFATTGWSVHAWKGTACLETSALFMSSMKMRLLRLRFEPVAKQDASEEKKPLEGKAEDGRMLQVLDCKTKRWSNPLSNQTTARTLYNMFLKKPDEALLRVTQREDEIDKEIRLKS